MVVLLGFLKLVLSYEFYGHGESNLTSTFGVWTYVQATMFVQAQIQMCYLHKQAGNSFTLHTSIHHVFKTLSLWSRSHCLMQVSWLSREPQESACFCFSGVNVNCQASLSAVVLRIGFRSLGFQSNVYEWSCFYLYYGLQFRVFMGFLVVGMSGSHAFSCALFLLMVHLVQLRCHSLLFYLIIYFSILKPWISKWNLSNWG